MIAKIKGILELFFLGSSTFYFFVLFVQTVL